MSDKKIECFGHTLTLDIDIGFLGKRLDHFCCDVCNSPDDYEYECTYLDDVWLCGECYQQATHELSKQGYVFDE